MTERSTLTLSPDPVGISLPFPARKHPDAARMEKHARDWAARFGLVSSMSALERMAESRFGEFAAWTNPEAPWPEAELAVEWMTWLCLADDQYEEGAYGSEREWRPVARAVRTVLEGGQPPREIAEAPLIRALASLSRRFEEVASPAWRGRFADHVTATMTSVFREIQLREAGIPPSLAEYIVLRRDAGAAFTTFDTIEICNRAELPGHVYQSSIFQDIVAAGVDIVGWHNDLYSVEKEMACGIVSNIVIVLRHHDGLSRDQGFARARDLINQRVDDLQRACGRLPDLARSLRLDSRTEQAAYRCAAGIRDWVAGSGRWHATGTARFHARPDGQPSPMEDLFASIAGQ